MRRASASLAALGLLWAPVARGAAVCRADEAGRLHPEDVPEMPSYSDWRNTTARVDGGRTIDVALGEIEHLGVKGSSSFVVLPGVVTSEEVSSILALVNASDAVTFDADPDSVDGMASHEIFVDNDALRSGSAGMQEAPGTKDGTLREVVERRPLRAKLQRLMQPILEQRLTAFVRQHYPEACAKSAERACYPCSSLIRRYRSGERQSHGTHYDSEARVTIVVSLSDFGREHRGGIYVAPSPAVKQVVPLARGDAVVHQSDLLHGVKVRDDGGERWSWILWYRDSSRCEDHGEEWFRDCAYGGSAVCQALYSNRMGISDDPARDKLAWIARAAEQGLGLPLVKLARAYLKKLPSKLPYDASEAERLYRKAIETAEEPDAQYGLAQLLLQGLAGAQELTIRQMLRQVVALLEAAAQAGHEYSMFNLGIAHLYGYAESGAAGGRDVRLAARWFEASGLPEGFEAAAMYYDAVGETATAQGWRERARRMGYGSIWRKRARQAVGSGGAGGVDLNMGWPPLPNGLRPPEW